MLSRTTTIGEQNILEPQEDSAEHLFDGPEISVVLPAHNEELILASTLEAIITALRERQHHFEVVLVENGSTDCTARIAGQLQERHQEIRMIRLPKGNYGEALYCGIASCSGRYIVTFDVDLYDFGFFDLAFDLIKNDHADLVIASKRAAGSQDHRSVLRRLLTFGFVVVLGHLIDFRVKDAHGMKLLQARRVTPLAKTCVMRGSLFDIELVVRAMHDGLRVIELPIDVRELRPPRTGIVSRTIESLRGAIKLRSVLRSERGQ